MKIKSPLDIILTMILVVAGSIYAGVIIHDFFTPPMMPYAKDAPIMPYAKDVP